jgi:dihydroflavonol-4-reductase
MTILVTGATGFVGSHVARQLVAAGERVRVLARKGSSRALLDGVAVQVHEGDLRDAPSLEAAVAGVERVFHVAADYRLWARNPREIYDSNVGGTRSLLNAARRAGVSRFVYTSTVATIAVHRASSQQNGSLPNRSLPNEGTQAEVAEMIGHYKKSKFLAEQEALNAAEQGLPVVIVNPTTPVGPGDAKPTPTGRIIVDFLNGRMPAYVETGLNLVPVEDVAVGHLLAAERGKSGERYILGGRNMTLKEILAALASICARPAPRIRLPHAVALIAAYADQVISSALNREPKIPLEGVRISRHAMFVDTSKAERDLGFRAGSVEAALERAVHWYQERGYVRFHAGNQIAQVRTV